MAMVVRPWGRQRRRARWRPDRCPSPSGSARSASCRASTAAPCHAKQAREAAKQEALHKKISQGPPPHSRINRQAWREWHQYGWIACPADKRLACKDRACGLGASCQAMKEIGLAGDGSPLPRRARPICGARNRQGKPCAVRVEPGKRRCRFHGGLSTRGQGPRREKRGGQTRKHLLTSSLTGLTRSGLARTTT
jgi:hypothetical protein